MPDMRIMDREALAEFPLEAVVIYHDDLIATSAKIPSPRDGIGAGTMVNPKMFRASVYYRVAFVSAISGSTGAEGVFRWLGAHQDLRRDICFVPASIITWLILVHFMRCRSVLRIILVGSISPLIGCIVGLLYFGAGLFWLPWVMRFYYVFAPIGILTSFIVWLAVRNQLDADKARGFDVIGIRLSEDRTKGPS